MQCLFRIMAYQPITLPSTGMSKPKSRRPSLPNIFAISPIDLSFPRLIIKDVLLPL